jgi:hypothetical protein
MIPLDLSENNIRNIVQSEFTEEYLKKDHEGIAQFIIEKILKRDSNGNYNYISTDSSRHIGFYKDIDTGYIIKDVKYMKLSIPVYLQACIKAKHSYPEWSCFDEKEIESSTNLISKYSEPHHRFKKYISNKTTIIYPNQTK